MFLKISQNSQENTRPEACNFIKRETLAQVFSCEFCEIFKNTFFTGHLRTTVSASEVFEKEYLFVLFDVEPFFTNVPWMKLSKIIENKAKEKNVEKVFDR